MLSLAAAVAAASGPGSAVLQPLHWEDLGLSPVALDLGFFTLKWYSLAYLAGILLGYWHLSKMIKAPGAPMAQRHADDLFFYATLGIILGGRLGYTIFYAPELWSRPADVLKLWEGGMSFHGGLVGVVLAIAWVAWKNKLPFLRLCDYVAVCVPFGMLFGRLANFVNGELWGRVAESRVAWAMVFPGAGDLPRHPSQLYLAGTEGLALIVLLLWLFWRTDARWRPGGAGRHVCFRDRSGPLHHGVLPRARRAASRLCAAHRAVDGPVADDPADGGGAVLSHPRPVAPATGQRGPSAGMIASPA